MGALDWLRGEYALLALLALPLVLLGLAALWGSRRTLASALSPMMRARAGVESSSSRRVTRVGLAAGAVCMLALALAGPVLGYLERPVVERGLDVVLCIDTSRSMLARDVRPSRLERAQREVEGLVTTQPGNRFAIVAFSGDARQVAPLTADRKALVELLGRVDVRDNRLGGTDLGAALERSLDLLDENLGSSSAIVLITDGEDLSGRGREVAARASADGVRVYVVGVGTSDGGKIPTVGPDGVERFLVGPDGQEVQTRLESETLRALAESTGGEYLSTESSATPLEALFTERILDLERRERSDGLERVPRDRYQWPLAVALVLALAEGALRERRTGTAKARRAVGA
ncbi:MAG: vWA domain-containing protein [Planctomycetota bacterium]